MLRAYNACGKEPLPDYHWDSSNGQRSRKVHIAVPNEWSVGCLGYNAYLDVKPRSRHVQRVLGRCLSRNAMSKSLHPIGPLPRGTVSRRQTALGFTIYIHFDSAGWLHAAPDLVDLCRRVPMGGRSPE